MVSACFHICSLLMVHIIPTYYLLDYKKSHKFIPFIIYETKKEIKKRLNTMPDIKMTLSWLFPHAICKNIFHYHLLHWHWFLY
jgi:hypothetical protein